MKARTRLRIALVLFSFSTLACSRADRPRGKRGGNLACIQIQQVVPEIFQVDDSGNTTEPIHLIIESHGGTEELKAGEAVYSEDDKEIKVTPVGDLHPGVQTIAIPPGLHSTSSSEHFEVALVGPNGKETVSLVLPLNSVGYVPPTEHDSGGEAKPSKDSDGHEDSEQQIATILPGVDPDEVMSIRQFVRDEVGITSFDGAVDRTEGDETHQPPQTLTIRGTNLKDGLIVHFSTTKGGQRIDASSSLTKTKALGTLAIPPGYSPNNPSILFGSIVIVPTQITHSVTPIFSVRSVHGETRSECK